MEVKLMRLELHDFKGIRDFALDAQGGNVTVLGANGTGKTTLANAFLWLLTGKDTQGRENYNIFPLQADGARVEGCMPTVSAVLMIDDQEVVLSRQLTEKWSKRAGSATAEYRGDETRCLVDDVPRAITKYNEWVECTVCPAELLPLLLNAAYFSEQTKDYRTRRELLLKQFGGAEEQEILESALQLAPLKEAMGHHSVEEMRQILTTQRKRYNEQMPTFPARIDELRRQITEDLPDEEQLKHQRGKQEVKLAQLRHKLQFLNAEQLAQDARRELAQIEQDITLLQTQRKTLQAAMARDGAQEHTARVERLAQAQYTAQQNLRRMQQEYEDLCCSADRMTREIDDLRKRWVQRNAEEAQVKDTCPTCGQALPPEEVQSAVDAYNLQKARDLDQIMVTATAKKDELAGVQRQQLELGDRLKRVQLDVERAEKAHALAVKEPKPEPVNNPIFYDMDRQEQALHESAEAARKKIMDAEQEAQREGQQLRQQIEQAKLEAEHSAEILTRIHLNVELQQRIAELQQEQRETLAQMDRTEMLLNLCAEYTRVMVGHLTEKINRHFKTVTFRLFESQKNGGLKEICEAAVDGVPYGALNTAAKMQVNVEIVEAFAANSGYRMPLFLDNRESVTNVTASPAMQLINLQVDPAKSLMCTTN